MLPIANYKEEIIREVKNNYVTIISAETGSGKSTQIPQYLSDFYQNVIVTEPRIMAAKTLATRVAEEMGVVLGDEVGYRTAYDKCFSKNSKILFCTDGLQLIRTIFSENTSKESVLIIDECHEWNLNIETLIAWCKQMKDKWNTKVVIMSATIETATLANFFENDVNILSVPGKVYDVEMEQRAEYKLIDTIKENINKSKNILVFVPGKKEITDVIEKLEGEDATVLPLHGEMDWDDQKRCFESYFNAKVIVATNVAQTSITIPDIDVVVDTGKARISIAEEGIQGLFLKDISRSDIIQRKGRAGRTKEGKYFLCSNTSFDDRDEIAIPEIQRSILDRVVLMLASIEFDAEKLDFYHQPEKAAIVRAKSELTAIGATDSNNVVTELGYRIVKMPVTVQLARMIVEAEKYGVTEAVMTIAAIVEIGGLLDKNTNYSDFTDEHNSDLLAEWDVWNKINKLKFIDFQKLGIRKKNFFKIKEHINKLREALQNIVEITNNNDRKAILHSCLLGWISNIYASEGRWEQFVGYDRNRRSLDKSSCIWEFSHFMVGKPKTIEFKNGLGDIRHLNLVSFATKIDLQTFIKFAREDSICENITTEYSEEDDAVKVIVEKYFEGILIDVQVYIDYNHPEYDNLKTEYEREEEERRN